MNKPESSSASKTGRMNDLIDVEIQIYPSGS